MTGVVTEPAIKARQARLLPDCFAQQRDVPVLALAPMQDVTDHAFMHLIDEYDGPDLWFTEYFRVHSTSTLTKKILRSIVENRTGKPIVAQLIGNDAPAMVRTIQKLEHYPIAAIDLNLGCPAPTVYRKCAGGGLLADPERVDRLLGELRQSTSGLLTVKTRTGFESVDRFPELLDIFERHQIDLLTVHGRTVKDGYRSEVRYDLIARAVQRMSCPVIANGNIDSPATAERVCGETGAAGLMIGRGAIRNPWLFRQLREQFSQGEFDLPLGHELLSYIERLFESIACEGLNEAAHVRKMKRYLNFIGVGVEPTGQFLHQIRRAGSREVFFEVCRRYLDHSQPLALVPFPKLSSRSYERTGG